MRTKKLTVFCFGIFLLLLMGLPVESTAAVNINVGISVPPPPFRFHAPPPMVVIPGTYIYAVPDIDVEILFYQGYWYRSYEGHWYRSKSYNGPWAYIDSRRVPRALFDLPPGYYQGISPRNERIPYGHFRNNWGRWERERYWDRNDRWREDRHRRYDDRHVAPPPRHIAPPPRRVGPPPPPTPHGPPGPPPKPHW